jgi:uncharacterized protein YqhQ
MIVEAARTVVDLVLTLAIVLLLPTFLQNATIWAMLVLWHLTESLINKLVLGAHRPDLEQ